MWCALPRTSHPVPPTSNLAPLDVAVIQKENGSRFRDSRFRSREGPILVHPAHTAGRAATLSARASRLLLLDDDGFRREEK